MAAALIIPVVVVSALAGGGVIYLWQRLKTPAPAPKQVLPLYLPQVFSYSFGSYYYCNCLTGEERFAPKLLNILGMGDYAADFAHFAAVLDVESFAALKQAKEELLRGKNGLQLALQSPDGKKQYECYANAEVSPEGGVASLVLWFMDTTASGQKLQRLTRENEKLKSELKQLSITLNTLPFPVWRRAEDLSIKYCNLAYSGITEESPEQVIDSEELELHKQSRAFARTVQESGEARTERRHIVVEGARRFFEIRETPVEDGVIIGSAHDLTELEVVREDLERHVSAQADLLESSTSAMAVYGQDMRLKLYNYAFAALWKLDETWLDSQPSYAEILEVLREKRKLPEQANFLAFKQQQLKLFTDLIAPQEEFYYLPDGKSLRVIAIPHALGGILFAYEDVTDRLALERSYNTLIAVQKETLDKLHEGVAVFGEDGKLKLSNPVYRKLWKLPDAVINQEPHFFDILEQTKEFFIAPDWERFKQQLMAHSQVRVLNYQRLERTDGSVLDWTSVPLPDGATLFTFFDVTDSTLVERSLREKNDALEAADRLKSEFLANVSYELRSPLTSISGFSEMLQQDYFGPLTDKQREYVGGIHQSSLQLMHLINDILDLATIEAGYMQLSVSRFDIQPMLHSVLALIRERAKELHILLTFTCPADIGSLLGDETRIKQAVFNLLNNALKYTATGGAVTLGAAASGEEELMFWVEDNGIGISPKEQAAVFGKFYKASSQGAPKAGTGLGLPMVKSFIELHGGRVELASTPGEGTKITCYLPRNNIRLETYLGAA